MVAPDSSLESTKGGGSQLMLVDSHCHLDLAQFTNDIDDVLARARQSGVRLIVNPGIDLHHSNAAIALAEKYDEVYAAVGIHPNSSHVFDDSAMAEEVIHELKVLSSHPKVVAIGEIGLDYYWDKVDPLIQKKGFELQLNLAADVGLPVIIHSREANEDVASILRSWHNRPLAASSPLGRRSYAGVLHAFSGDYALAAEAYTWQFLLSLGGPITYKNAHNLHELLPQLDIERLMLETDAPFLTPHPFRGKRNEPSYIKLVCHRIAEVIDEPVESVAEKTTNLAYQFFGLEP